MHHPNNTSVWGYNHQKHSKYGSGELEADMKTIKTGTYTASNSDMDFSSSVGMPKPITVTVTEDGKVAIPQVEMTSQGASTNGLDAYRQQDAGLSCYLTGGSYITSGYRENVDYTPIVNLKNGCVAGYRFLDFGTGAGQDNTMQLALTLKPLGTVGTIDVYIDKNNTQGK